MGTFKDMEFSDEDDENVQCVSGKETFSTNKIPESTTADYGMKVKKEEIPTESEVNPTDVNTCPGGTDFMEVMVKVELKEDEPETCFNNDDFAIDKDSLVGDSQMCQIYIKEENTLEQKPQKRRGHYKKCPHCEKQFSDSTKLRFHIYSHTGEKPFDCDVCQKQFNHPRLLKRHKLLHEEKNIACHHCSKSFSDQTLLGNHLKYIGLSFPCDICGNVYARKENLKAHQRKHTGETPYQCPHCEDKFTMSYKLKEHINSKHLNIEKQLHVCEFCGKEYKKRSDMNEHANTHTGDTTSQCRICQETFNTKTAHREHINIHNKRHECKDCGKCFGNARNLERHEKAHNGIKDFKCSICAKPYTSLRSLQKHMEIKHDITQGKKQTFSCEICKRSFTRADYLERHTSKH